MSGEINLMNSGGLNNFPHQIQSNKTYRLDIDDQSFNPDLENLYNNANQLSNLLISLGITSIEDINSKTNQITESIPEINRLINLIIKKLSFLQIPPKIAIGSKPMTHDVYNVLSFASLLLYNQKNHKTIEQKNLPSNTTQTTYNTNKNDLKDNPELDSVNKTRLFVLEGEMQSIQLKYQGLNEECQKRRAKIQSLQAENNKLLNQNESQEKEIYKLKAQIEQLQIEKETLIVNQNAAKLDLQRDQINKELIKQQNKGNDEYNLLLNSLQAELEITTKENQNLKRALFEISKEMAKDNLNLRNEVSQRNNFVSIIQEQIKTLDEYERLYQSNQTKVTKTEATLQAAQETIQHLEAKQRENQKNQNLNSKTLDELKIYFSTKSDFNNKKTNNNFNIITNILNILQNDKNTNAKENIVYSKIIEIFDFLFIQMNILNDKANSFHLSTEVADLAEIERVKKVNDRLSQYIMSMIQFFEHLANSGEMQGWMIELPCNDDLRPLLLSQCNKVENFVKKNQQCKSFYEVKNEEEMTKFLTENKKDETTNNNNKDNKIKNDDLLSVPSLIEKLISDFDEFENNSNKPKSKSNNSKKVIHSLFKHEKEFLIILHLCASANDALRRCAERTIDSNRLLSDEIKKLRHEMQLANKDCEMRINEVTESFETKIQEDEESIKNAESLLRKIQDELRRSDEVDFERKNSAYELFVNKKIIKKCLAILNGDEIESSELEEKDEVTYYSSFSENEPKKVTQTTEKNANDESKDELLSEIESLRKQVKSYEKKKGSSDSLEQRNKLLETERKKIINELKSSTQQMKELKKKLESIHNENTVLKTEIKSLKNNEISLKKDSDNVLELTEEIESLRQKNEELSISFDKEKKVTRKAVKSRIKSLQTEIENQQRKNEDLKNSFEKILDDFKNKLKEATEKNAKSMQKEQELILLNKQLSSELSTTKVDLKMLQMKIETIEERVQRDKKLVETQCKMKVLNFQTKCQSEIEKIKSKFECKIHNFQISVVQHFKEFMNFRNTINEDSVFEVLNQVSSELKRLNSLCSSYELINKDMTAIKALVGGFDSDTEMNNNIEDNNQLLIKITELVETKNRYSQLEDDFQILQKKFENNQNLDNENDYLKEDFESVSAYEWEQWARKVAALASDNFLLIQSARELQSSIEESLLGSINQRMVTKRLEILRAEKKILTSGALNNTSDTNCYISINTLIILITAVRKLQKVSGHLPCTIPQPIRALELMKKKNANKKNF